MKKLLRTTLISLSFLFLWHGFVRFTHLPDYILPSPWQVFSVLYQQHLLIISHFIPTATEIMAGFLFGIFVGLLVAVLMSLIPHLARWSLPFFIFSQSIPTFAIAPLFVIWFGYGITSKIAIAILMIFFPISSALYDGLNRTPIGWLDLAQTINNSKWRIFWTIRLPAALPALATGMRIAAVSAPLGAIVGEWVGSSRGLGYLMMNANARMQIDLMFAALMVVMLMALVLYVGTDQLMRRIVWWSEVDPGH